MPIASYDKSMVRIGIDPATGNYVNHNDTSSLPKVVSEEVYKRIVASTPQLKWTLEGEKMVHNDTKTVKEAFSIIPGDREIELMQSSTSGAINQLKEELSDISTKTLDLEKSKYITNPMAVQYIGNNKPTNMNNIDEAILVFTRVVVDMHRATGTKEKLSRKSYANGFARALLILYPDMSDKIKRISSDSQDNSEDNIIF